MGYNRGQTDRLLDEIAVSFEDVWRERADLADKVEQLEADLVRFRELETLLRTTLVVGRARAAEMKEQARREADLILSEAHAEARKVQRDAIGENERLIVESRRLRAQLRDGARDDRRRRRTPKKRRRSKDDGQNTWPGEREAA